MSYPTDAELAELQDPETWDWDSAERHKPNPHAFAVVRVRFPAAEFRALAQAARAAHLTMASFIRQAALDRVHGVSADESAATQVKPSAAAGVDRNVEGPADEDPRPRTPGKTGRAK